MPILQQREAQQAAATLADALGHVPGMMLVGVKPVEMTERRAELGAEYRPEPTDNLSLIPETK